MATKLAKAVRELDGRIYVHCHHGKHRSPAAASVACVGAGLLLNSQAAAVLELAGTSKEYTGLFQSSSQSRKFDDWLLSQLQVEFRWVVDVPPMAEAMVSLEQRHDHLKQFSANDWQMLADHLDLTPAHETLILREHFTEFLRTDETKDQPQEFQDGLAGSIESCREMEAILKTSSSDSVPARQPLAEPRHKKLNLLHKSISDDCYDCHRSYRN